MWKLLNYWWRLFGKTFSFALFGIGALVLSILVFPTIHLCVRSKRKSRRALRRTVSGCFSLFVQIMTLLGLVRVRVQQPERLRKSRGVIVVANHPTLIDVVILIAQLPQADCIVKSQLRKNPFVSGVVRRIYIPNSLSFQETVNACAESMAEGNNLVIFPEGTRSAADAAPRLKRGSAQFALRIGCDILPVVIKVKNPRGLRKGDPFFSLSREGPMIFDIEPLEPISVAAYREQETSRGARILTKEIQARIFSHIQENPLEG
jgi:1-acyl-sn-glycerol-3-phosphate acyltransferase